MDPASHLASRRIPGAAPKGSSTDLQLVFQQAERRLTEAGRDVVHANPELRGASTEQLLNEELRMSVEELAASEEALQSANQRLADQVQALGQAEADMRSILASTRIAIIFLDRELRIRSFTPAMQEILHLRDTDCGRPVTDLALRIGYPGLTRDALAVLQHGGMVQDQADHTLSDAHYLIRLLPHRNDDERIDGVVVTFFDITAEHRAQQALRASEDQFRRMAEAVPALLFIAAADRTLYYVNPPFYTLTGMAPGTALGRGWEAAMQADDAGINRVLWQRASDAAGTLEQEARIRCAGGGFRWFLIRAVPQTNAMGEVVRWYGSCTDIDDRRQAEKRQSLLLAEVQHRTKNILAVVRSLLSRTLSSSTDLAHFADHLSGRIGALARTQAVAARTPEGVVLLEELIYEELACNGGTDENQVMVAGPAVRLPPKTADSLSLVLHELATNSVKYGALAASGARLSVTWMAGAEGAAPGLTRLQLEWSESGVPLTDLSPRHRGFGRELIEQILPYEARAKTLLEFRPGGVRCRIEMDVPGEQRAARDLISTLSGVTPVTRLHGEKE